MSSRATEVVRLLTVNGVTLAVAESWLGRGVGHAILTALEDAALALGVARLFCLTFEEAFFRRHGFQVVRDVDGLSRVVEET